MGFVQCGRVIVNVVISMHWSECFNLNKYRIILFFCWQIVNMISILSKRDSDGIFFSLFFLVSSRQKYKITVYDTKWSHIVHMNRYEAKRTEKKQRWPKSWSLKRNLLFIYSLLFWFSYFFCCPRHSVVLCMPYAMAVALNFLHFFLLFLILFLKTNFHLFSCWFHLYRKATTIMAESVI